MVKLTASEFIHQRSVDGAIALQNNAFMAKKRPISTFQKRPDFNRTFIREWREFRGLTQPQLAARIEKSVGMISMLENGKRGFGQKTMEAVADALQTDVASLTMRDPTKQEAIWSIWEQASTADRNKIVEIARTITGIKTGTDDR